MEDPVYKYNMMGKKTGTVLVVDFYEFFYKWPLMKFNIPTHMTSNPNGHILSSS